MNIAASNNVYRLLRIGLVANLFEWLEYSMYGCLVLTMGKLFWGEADAVTLLARSWLTFAVSYFSRPLGSIFWGYIGDKYGHSHSLSRSLVIMAIPTVLIGTLPVYDQVGLLAPAALIILRFTQGFAAGGEMPISACYIYEKAPKSLRSILCSTIHIGVGLGLLGGTILVKLLEHFFTEQQILSWAWRIPYLLSFPLSVFILSIRRSIDTAPATEAREGSPASEASLNDTLGTRSLRALNQSLRTLRTLNQSGLWPLIFLVGFVEVSCYVLLFWLPDYLTVFLGVDTHIAQNGKMLILAFLQVFCVVMGYISSRIGYKRILLIHTTLTALLAYPLFQALQTSSVYTLMGIHIIFAWLYSGFPAVMMEVLGDAYPKAVRGSGMSITHTVGATFFGGITPWVCTQCTQQTGLFLLFPAYYIIAMAILALPIIWRLKVPEQIE